MWSIISRPFLAPLMILRMARMGRLELQASCSQTVELNFFWLFLMVLTLFTTFHSLFGALNSTVSEYSGAVRGQICGQRGLLDQVRHNGRRLFKRALFYIQVWDIVPLSGPRSKVFFQVRHINFQNAYTKNIAWREEELPHLLRS